MQKLNVIRTRPPESNYERPLIGGRTSDAIYGRRWKRFRKGLLQEQRLQCAAQNRSICWDCHIEGKNFTPGRWQLHHRVPIVEDPTLQYEPSNCVFLCPAHHGLRTDWERCGAKHPHRHVVYGRPGAGKTTYVKQHAEGLIWDADAMAQRCGYPRYEERTREQGEHLQAIRAAFLAEATATPQQIWVILRWPNTAWRIAARIGAGEVISLDCHEATIEARISN